MRKFAVLLMLIVIVLLSAISCAPTVPQPEYDRVNNELSAIQSQLASLQAKLAEYETIQAKYDELSKQFETVKSEYKAMQAKYEELSQQYNTATSEYETMQAKYEELSKQYNLLTKGAAEINESNVEQAIFKLVNQERVNHGLNELGWGDNLYKWAKANSLNMANNKRLEYSEYTGWQEVYWATGYSTVDSLANSVLVIWKNGAQYERIFLNTSLAYSAVAAYKSGEIFYITYIADYFR